MKDIKRLVINIIIPLGLGTLSGLLSSSMNSLDGINQPTFAPAPVLFPIIWTILYILMGVSAYLIEKTNNEKKEKALKTYYISLAINLLWSFIFFKFQLFLLSTLWIILLLYFVIKMIIEYFKIKKIASYLQFPYILWLIFALILNISIYLLN